MKKIIILLLIITCFKSQAQSYTFIAQRYDWIAGHFRQGFGFPYGVTPTIFSGQKSDPGQAFYNTTDTSLYLWTGTQWLKSGGSDLDTTSLSDRINLKLNISDTSAMLSPYLYNANEGLIKSGKYVQLGNVWATPAQLTTSRSIDLNLQKFFFQKGDTILDDSFTDFNGDRNTPLGAVIIDSVGPTNNPDYDVLPKMGGSWTRIIRWDGNGRRMHNRYGWRFKYQYELSDSVRDQGDGGDYQSALIADKLLVPIAGSNTKRLYVSGHGTNSWIHPNEGIPSLIGNTQIFGNDSAYIYVKGYMKGVGSYLVMGAVKDTVENFVYYGASSYITANNWLKKSYFLRPDVYWNRADSVWFAFDTVSLSRTYQAGKWMLGKSVLGTWSMPHTLAVNGGSVFTDTAGYWTNVAARFTARSFVDKNYVDSAIAANVGSIPDLMDVLNQDNSTSLSIFFDGGARAIFQYNASPGGILVSSGTSQPSSKGNLIGGSNLYDSAFKFTPPNVSSYGFHFDGSLITTDRRLWLPDEEDTVATRTWVRDNGGGGGTTVTLGKGFMHDTMTVSGVKTIIPRYTWWDDFLGSNSAIVGSVFLMEFASGTGADASREGAPSGITGATGDGYGRAFTGTTTTGTAIFQINALTNQNEVGDVDYDKYYRISFKNVIIPVVSDGTETYSIALGFGVNSTVNNSIVVTYTHSDNSGAFVCSSHAGTTPESTNTAVTVAANTEYNIDIEFYNGTVKFWINGTLVATHSTQVPADTGIMRAPFARILKSAGTTGRELFIDAIGLRITPENDL